MKQASKNHTNIYPYLIGFMIIVTAALVFSKLFNAGFLSWDDADYVTDNRDVHEFNLKALFTKFYVGNYHPITMLNYALDWKLFAKNALGYHIENIVWHLINCYLVYLFVSQFLKNSLSSLLVALIFCLHPLQLETVAWIAERKNLLYTFFLLLAAINYLSFLRYSTTKYWVLTLLFFVFSVLSKPSAIVFPILLFAIDYIYFQKFSLNKWHLKIPFFIISIAIGVITLHAQAEGKFLNDSHDFALHQQVGYAGYAIVQYFSKFLFPIDLSVIYPYPVNVAAALLIGFASIILILFLLWKLWKQKQTTMLFGLLFFIINLLLVLQFIPFGEVLTADRYMYVPIIGLALMVVFISEKLKSYFKYVLVVLPIVLSVFTYARSNVWKNSTQLYLDILNKYPHSFVALNSVGAEYMLGKNYDMASRYLNKAINENVNYYKGYYNRGLMYAQTNRYKEALKDFNKCLYLKEYPKAYVARANVFYAMKDFPKAIQDVEKAIRLEPQNSKAYFVMANCHDDLNQLDKALSSYSKAINYSPETAIYYLRRAIVYGKMQNFNSCLNDLDAAIFINPDFAEAYYWKGVVKVNLKQSPCGDFQKALDLGFEEAKIPLQNYCR
jgi:tetratricopeptide (TPR) repeat protein